MGRPFEARSRVELAVQLAPNDAHTWRVLAEIYVSTGDPTAARVAYQRVRSLDPHGPLRDVADAALKQRPPPSSSRPKASRFPLPWPP